MLANDTDIDGRPADRDRVAEAAHGTLELHRRPLSYTPAANYNGPDSFTYNVPTARRLDTATVTITVTPVNDEPVAVNDAYVAEDTARPPRSTSWPTTPTSTATR